jgi:DNA-binding GntR family transcriptional regulator
MLRVPGTEDLTLSEHSQILIAIAEHDPDAAVFALRAHLTRAHPLYEKKAFASNPWAFPPGRGA